MRKKRAPEVQNLLAALKAKMAAKGASSESIVAAFIKQYPEVIARENGDLVYTALMKYVGSLGVARTPGSTATQLEMFSEFHLPKTVLFRKSDGSKEHRQVQSLTLGEAREYIDDHKKPRARISSTLKEMVRLVDTVGPFKASEKSTIGQCWVEYQKAQGG